MSGERTEAPTARRQDDARKRGQVAMSKEMDSALVLLAAFIAMRFSAPGIWHGFDMLIRESIQQMGDHPVTAPLAAELGPALIWRAIMLVLPMFGIIAAVGALGGAMQTGGVFSFEAITPKPSRLNPMEGLKRMLVSKQSVVTLAKTLLKFVVIGGVAYMALNSRLPELASLGLATSVETGLSTIVEVGNSVVTKVLAVLFVIAVADFIFQRYQLLSQLRMTKQEVKDENRQSEGDPAVKARIARLRRSFLSRIMQAVPQADVVLMNPTHYAVALKYDPATSSAPKVIAKGERLMALRIRELAMECGIPVIQNPPLTRAIYRAVPVGREITPDLYEAVAAVLAFVYRLRFPGARAAG